MRVKVATRPRNRRRLRTSVPLRCRMISHASPDSAEKQLGELCAWRFENQYVEAAIKCAVLDRMSALDMPDSLRVLSNQAGVGRYRAARQ